ncbi:MAG: cation:proton antiporter, partial [Pirellulaceae bacterium]
MDETQQTIAVLASIFVLGIGGHWLAWRLNVPAILLLLLVGFTAGPLTGWIDPEAMFGGLLLPLVSMAVALILFEGGVNLRFRELRGTWASLIGLLTVGVLVTWGGATMAGIWLLQLPIPVAMVLGAILTVTGPTVIGPLLRDIRPKGRAGVIAKWEGIIVDPIGATLALLVFEAADAIRVAEFSTATRSALAGLAMVVVIGLTAGLVAAVLLV